MIICEPSPYDVVSITVRRESPGKYTLYEAHRHEGALSYCPQQDSYSQLTWSEALDLSATLIDARRPGMTPAGWEQLQIDYDRS